MTLEFFKSSDCNHMWLKVKSFTFPTGIPIGILEEFWVICFYLNEILKELQKILLKNINSSCRQAMIAEFHSEFSRSMNSDQNSNFNFARKSSWLCPKFNFIKENPAAARANNENTTSRKNDRIPIKIPIGILFGKAADFA